MGLTQQTGKEGILTGYIVRYLFLQIHLTGSYGPIANCVPAAVESSGACGRESGEAGESAEGLDGDAGVDGPSR